MFNKYIQFRNYKKYLKNRYVKGDKEYPIPYNIDKKRLKLLQEDMKEESAVSEYFSDENNYPKNIDTDTALAYQFMESKSKTPLGKLAKYMSHSYLGMLGMNMYMFSKLIGFISLFSLIINIIAKFKFNGLVIFLITFILYLITKLAFILIVSKKDPVRLTGQQ